MKAEILKFNFYGLCRTQKAKKYQANLLLASDVFKEIVHWAQKVFRKIELFWDFNHSEMIFCGNFGLFRVSGNQSNLPWPPYTNISKNQTLQGKWEQYENHHFYQISAIWATFKLKIEVGG